MRGKKGIDEMARKKRQDEERKGKERKRNEKARGEVGVSFLITHCREKANQEVGKEEWKGEERTELSRVEHRSGEGVGRKDEREERMK